MGLTMHKDMFEAMTEELVLEVLNDYHGVEIFVNGKLYKNIEGVIHVDEHDTPPDDRVTLK